MIYYSDKKIDYFSGWREDLFNLIKKYGNYENSFEIGCGSGKLSYELKKSGIVIKASVLEPYGIIQYEGFEQKHQCTIEDLINADCNNEKYNLIIFGDILEHTIDPWTILQKISKDYLCDNGIVVISIPNIRNFRSLYKIVFKNSFKYESEGVFDKTHLRFFCIPDVVELIRSSLLNITYMNASFEYREFKYFSKNRLRIINKLTFGIFKYWLADQVLFVCKK